VVGLVEGGVDVACNANHLALRRGGSARSVRSVQRGSMFASSEVLSVEEEGRAKENCQKKKGFCKAGVRVWISGTGSGLLAGWLVEWLEPKS